jgi:hypothetical protein
MRRREGSQGILSPMNADERRSGGLGDRHGFLIRVHRRSSAAKCLAVSRTGIVRSEAGFNLNCTMMHASEN